MRRWSVAERIQEWEVGDKSCVSQVLIFPGTALESVGMEVDSLNQRMTTSPSTLPRRPRWGYQERERRLAADRILPQRLPRG